MDKHRTTASGDFTQNRPMATRQQRADGLFRGGKRHPQTRLSARRHGSAKKHAARYGMRMRHRWTNRPAKQKRKGQRDTPSWRQITDADCYSRALLTALFFATCRAGMPVLSSGLLCQPCCFLIYPLVIRLAASLIPPAPNTLVAQAQTHVEMESAISNAAQHRLGVRMRYRRGIPANTGHDKPPEERACPDIETTMSARALLVAFVGIALFPRRGAFESIIRLAPRPDASLFLGSR